MSKRIDLLGQVFGKLTVICESEKRGSRKELYWRCRCSCGNETDVRSDALRNNKVQSCGCGLAEDLTGRRFEQLEVIHRSKKTNTHGEVYWVCQCSCGKRKDITANGLRSGFHKSCGCRRLSMSNPSKRLIPGHMWNRIVSGAKRRAIDFRITEAEAEELYFNQDMKCSVTGVYIGFDRKNHKGSGTLASLDRIDSSGPYSVENCRWVSKDLNMMKRNMNEDDFILQCNLVSRTNSYQGFSLTPMDNAGSSRLFDLRIDQVSDREFNLLVGDNGVYYGRGSVTSFNAPDGTNLDDFSKNYVAADARLEFRSFDYKAIVLPSLELVEAGYEIACNDEFYGRSNIDMLLLLDPRNRNRNHRESNLFEKGKHFARVQIVSIV